MLFQFSSLEARRAFVKKEKIIRGIVVFHGIVTVLVFEVYVLFRYDIIHLTMD